MSEHLLKHTRRQNIFVVCWDSQLVVSTTENIDIKSGIIMPLQKCHCTEQMAHIQFLRGADLIAHLTTPLCKVYLQTETFFI